MGPSEPDRPETPRPVRAPDGAAIQPQQPSLRDPPRLDALGEPLNETLWGQPNSSRAFDRPWQARTAPAPSTLDKFLSSPVEQSKLLARAVFSQEAQNAFFGKEPIEKIYSVPRRFDISTLFVVSSAFAMLFAVMGYSNLSSAVKLAVCFYVSGVGFAQAALFSARAPRAASIISGALLLALLTLPTFGRAGPELLCAMIALLVGGCFCGYIVGTVVGGVFLVADKFRTYFFGQP